MQKLIRNIGAIKRTLGHKWNLVKGKNKKRIIAGGFTLVVLSTALAGCGNKKDETAEILPQPPAVTDVDLEQAPAPEPGFTFLSDTLRLSGINLVNDLDTATEAEQYLDTTYPGFFDENGNYINPDGEIIEDVTIGDGFVAPDGTLWTSEDEYNEYIQGLSEQQVIEDFNGYVAPDGSLWESEQDYLDYVNGLAAVQPEESTPEEPAPEVGGGDATPEEPAPETPAPEEPAPETPSESNDAYLAPDGTYWESEQDYLDYINSQTSTETYYTAPDGSLWDTQEDYEIYTSSLAELDTPVDPEVKTPEEPAPETPAPETPAPEEPTPEVGGGETTPEEPEVNAGYIAPDGTYWESQAEYEEFIASNNDVVPEEQNGTETDYYIAPDGTAWVSEAEYNEYVNSMAATETAAPAEATQEQAQVVEAAPAAETVVEPEVVAEPVVVEEPAPAPAAPVVEETGYFVAPDGEVWVSQSDYEAYQAMESTDEMVR